ncbi:MAG: ornithine cyclodeaminase family protein [Halobacteriales archaeon]|nr:ornithine cyclodeaminase family protein [Halobacteriales archaeon]
MTDALFLTSEDVIGLATPAEYVAAVTDAYRQVGEGAPAEPRTTLGSEDPPGKFTGYMAILPETGGMGGYMYSAGFGRKDAWFVAPLFDAETGEPLALIDGTAINPFKTGAVGATGVDALAREDSQTLAIIGSGSQAAGQLQAAVTVRDFESVRVYSPTRENREAFAAEFDRTLEPTIQAVDSASDAVRGADVVITATRAAEPVFDGEDLEDGAHVTAIGQYQIGKRELDVTTIKRATYVPDLASRVTRDAGSFIYALEQGAITEDHVHAELGEVIAGSRPGRTSDEEVTVFDSGGTAIETVAAAHMLYEKAVDAGLGQSISIAPASEALTGRLPEK